MASLFLSFLLLSAMGGVSGQFQLEPQKSMVLQGTEARFNASLQGEWQIMTWTVNGLFVLTIDAERGPVSYSDRFSATNKSSGDISRWEFNIRNVSRNDSGPIICSVQGPIGERTAQLSVQDSGTVDILGGNVTVVQGQRVEFQCLTTAWFPEPVVSWMQNGDAVNTSLYNTTTEALGDWFNSTSALSFNAVNNATIECLATVPALTSPLSSFIYLVVEKPVAEPDWTVLIAVVVSFGGFALLVLLILGIIFCCKHKKEKESKYQDEMRRVRTLSQISSISVAGQRQGQTNLGYVTDGQTSVPSSENDSGFSQTNMFEIPDVINSNQAANNNTLDGPGFRTHRHATIV